MNTIELVRRPYSQPQMISFGRVVDLTAAGSGTGTEPNPVQVGGACQGNTKTNKPVAGCV